MVKYGKSKKGKSMVKYGKSKKSKVNMSIKSRSTSQPSQGQQVNQVKVNRSIRSMVNKSTSLPRVSRSLVTHP